MIQTTPLDTQSVIKRMHCTSVLSMWRERSHCWLDKNLLPPQKWIEWKHWFLVKGTTLAPIKLLYRVEKRNVISLMLSSCVCVWVCVCVFTLSSCLFISPCSLSHYDRCLLLIFHVDIRKFIWHHFVVTWSNDGTHDERQIAFQVEKIESTNLFSLSFCVSVSLFFLSLPLSQLYSRPDCYINQPRKERGKNAGDSEQHTWRVE